MKQAICIGVAVVSLFTGLASAGTPPSPNLPTEIVVPYVPVGWKNTRFEARDADELAEFTPTGQPTPLFTNLVGYDRRAFPPGKHLPANFSFDAMFKAEQAGRCTAGTLRGLTPVGGMPGWRNFQTYCLIKSGPAAGRVDVTFRAMLVRDGAVVSTWRAWRGTPEEFRRFLFDTGRVKADGLIKKDGADAFDDAVIDRATPTILDAWSGTFTKVEVCDLAAGEICPSFRAAPGTLAPKIIASLTLKGSHELTTQRVLELEEKIPGPQGAFASSVLSQLKDGKRPDGGIVMAQSISLSNFDWADPASAGGVIHAPALGAMADGGILTAIDEAPPADLLTRARMQAYVVMVAHFLWKAGIGPDRQTLVLAPPG